MNVHQRGAALMLVLWLVALMTVLVGSFALSARVESMLGRGLGRSVTASEAARSGIELALYQLWHAEPTQRWQADGRTYRWAFDSAEVTLRLVDTAGLIDLNASDGPLLAALIRQSGVSAQRAETLAVTIVGWRTANDPAWPEDGVRHHTTGRAYAPRNAPFESVAELQGVLDMDAALYTWLRPHLTLYSGRTRPDPRFAPPPVLAALGLDVHATLSLRERDDRSPPASSGGPVVIEASARLADGRESRVSAVVRAGAGGNSGTYRVLEWKEGGEWQ